MSLQVWLPLNGNLNNQGLSTTTFSGTPNWKTYGKLSNTSLNLQNRITCSTPALNGIQFFSVTFWARIEANTESTANWMDVIGFTDISTSNSSGQFRFETGYGNTAYGGIHWHDNATNAIINGSYTYNTASEYNNWHHIAVTINDTAIKSYYDGQLKQTHTTNLNKGHLNGNWWIGESTTRGCIQDIRIYDHALSDKEVQEIAKGLVLHYKLDNNGFGQTNLLPCGGTYTKNNPWTTTLSRTDGYTWVTGSAFEATPSMTYTISVECDGTLSSGHGPSGIAIANKPFTFWLYICNTNTTKSWSTGAYDTPVNLNSTNYNYRKIGNTHIWTYTLSNSQKYISLRTNSYSDGTTPITINWWNMKIEQGDTFTPWIPNNTNNLYTSMGLDNNIIYDSSGYENNSIITGNLTINNDTKKYLVSTNMNNISTSNHIETISNFILPIDAITATCWVKAAKSTNHVIFVFPQLEFGTLNNLGYINLNSSAGFTLNNFINNDWNFIVVIRQNTVYKLYINGVEETANGTNNYYLHNGNKLYLLNRNYNNNYAANATISDFRIYTTILTTTQIQELYNTSMTIDKDGNTYTRELVEI